MPRNADREGQWLKRLARAGEFLEAVGDGHGATGLVEGRVTSIKLRVPTQEEPESLLVVQAEAEGGKFVAFVGALGMVDCLLIWRAKDARAGLKWRESIPWGER